MDGQDRQDADRIFTLTLALCHRGSGEFTLTLALSHLGSGDIMGGGLGLDTSCDCEQLRCKAHLYRGAVLG